MGGDKEKVHNFGAETSLKATIWKIEDRNWMALAGIDIIGVEPLDSQV
jgi:hypothetical protein